MDEAAIWGMMAAGARKETQQKANPNSVVGVTNEDDRRRVIEKAIEAYETKMSSPIDDEPDWGDDGEAIDNEEDSIMAEFLADVSPPPKLSPPQRDGDFLPSYFVHYNTLTA